MSDPKDWKIGDIVKVKFGSGEQAISNISPLGVQLASGLLWRRDELEFIRTAEAEAVRLSIPAQSVVEESHFPITHNEFSVTFPPTAKTVNVSVHPETKCSVNGTVVQPGLESPKDAKPHPFYVGQRLVCVDGSGSGVHLKPGVEYYVSECISPSQLQYTHGHLVMIHGSRVPGWDVSRFKPAPFKVGDKVRRNDVKPVLGERDPYNITDYTVTSVAEQTNVGRPATSGQWLRFDGSNYGWECKFFNLVTPAPEPKPEPPNAPEPAPFRVGDVVTCVDASRSDRRLVQGGDYVIERLTRSLAYVSSHGSTYTTSDNNPWAQNRFVHKVIKKPAQVTFCGVDMGTAEVDSSPKWYDMGNRREYRDAFVAAFEKAMKNAPPTKLEPVYGPSPLCAANQWLCDSARFFSQTRSATIEHVIRLITPDGEDPREWLKAQRCEMIYPPRTDSDIELCQIHINGIAEANVITDYKNLSCRWEMIQVPAKPTEPEKPRPFKVGDVVICVEKSDWDCRSMAKPGDIRKVIRVTDDNCLEFVVGQSPNSAKRFKLYEPKFSPMDLVECIEGCSNVSTSNVCEVSRASDTHIHVTSCPTIGFPSNRFKIYKTADQRMVEIIEKNSLESVDHVRKLMAEAASHSVGHIEGSPLQTIGRLRNGKHYPTSPQSWIAMAQSKRPIESYTIQL